MNSPVVVEVYAYTSALAQEVAASALSPGKVYNFHLLSAHATANEPSVLGRTLFRYVYEIREEGKK